MRVTQADAPLTAFIIVIETIYPLAPLSMREHNGYINRGEAVSNTETVPLQGTLEAAIIEHLATPELYTDYDGCTLGGLIMELQGSYREDIWACVQDLIAARRAYVPVPLSMTDLDTYVLPVCWTVGVSNRADIEAEFGPPQRMVTGGKSRVLTFDLYLRNADSSGVASTSVSHAVRDAANEHRPPNCSFPYSGILPSEALQIEFTFDDADVLVDFRFKVDSRLS